MDIKDILGRLDLGIQQLLQGENDILKRGLKELNVNGHLARYLTPLFSELTVDSEYNGDIQKPNDRKALDIAKSRMTKIGIRTRESGNYQLTPDIIIHRRRANHENLVVIEVKKDSNSRKEKEFDLLKLEHMTIDYLGNHYNYKLGVALIFCTKENAGKYEIKYFQRGKQMDRSKLK